MPTTNAVYLSLDFDQLLGLARQLPDDEKRQLADLLMQEQEGVGTIPEDQKQLVLARIKKYDQYPELMIEEEQALAMINQM